MEEEKKNVEENESDFADEVAPLEEQESTLPPPEETKEEEKPEEKNWDREGEAPEVKSAGEITDERLKLIESRRADFHKKYKKTNIFRWVVSLSALALIVLGYVIPTTVPPMAGSTWGIYITLGVLILAVLCIAIYSFVSRRWINKHMKQYFADYYASANSYVYEGDEEGAKGDVDTKLEPLTLKEAKTYEDIYKIGSRDTLKFSINGKNALVSDCAAQISIGKQLKTVFVGKLFVIDNEYKGDQILLYIKGYSRGLPPTALSGKEEILNDGRMAAFGNKTEFAKIFSDKTLKTLLDEFDTNKILVDVTISIVEGKTYYFMGYDDSAMVLPLEKPLVLAPLDEIKKNYASIKKVDSLLNL
ncbi:MAG: hypothetical protein IJ247_04200 [Bacilli bacterium]|nr:hypothetical protein [Bacilli bacterium]